MRRCWWRWSRVAGSERATERAVGPPDAIIDVGDLPDGVLDVRRMPVQHPANMPPLLFAENYSVGIIDVGDLPGGITFPPLLVALH